MPTVAATLHAFQGATLVPRAVAAVLAVVPNAPVLAPWAEVDDAVRERHPDADEALLGACRALADDAVSQAVLDLGTHLDAADRALGKHVRGGPVEPQAEDAVLKALAIGWFSARTGGAEVFRALPSGRALVAWWAAADVALPLGGGDLGTLLAGHRATQASRLASMVGEEAFAGTVAALEALQPTLQKVVDAATKRSDALLRALAPFVPGLVADGAGADEEVGARADRMPVYKWLAARLAVEHAIARASSAGR